MGVTKAEDKLPSTHCYFRLLEDEDDGDGDDDCYYAYYVSF